MIARLWRDGCERGWLLALAVLIVYGWLAPTHIVAADNAEFATLGAVGGRAHPSGYPLYVLWLRAWSIVPGLGAAHRAALATVVIAAMQALVLHAACRAWGARAIAATIAVAMFAAAPFVIRIHVEADVFALNSLVAAAVLWLAAADGPFRGVRRAAALGLVAGLGVANNLTCVLLAPIGLYGIVRAIGEHGRRRAGVAAIAVVAFAVGLLPYVYLVVAPEATSWGKIDSARDLLDLVLRRDYGYTSHVGGARVALDWAPHAAYLQLLGRTWLWLPALLGFAVIARRSIGGADRWAWRMLAVSWLLAGPLLTTLLGIDSHGVGGYIGGRMQILSLVVLAIPIAIAIDELAARSSLAASSKVAFGLVAAGFATLVVAAVPGLARVHSAAVELGARNLLRTLPRDAVVLVVSEDQCFGVRYLQIVERERADVTLVCWLLESRAWYRERIAGQGVKLAWGNGLATVADAEALLASGRPLLVDGAQATLLAALPSYPYGVLVRVLPRGAPTPSLAEVVALNRDVFARFDLSDVRPERGDDFAAVAHQRYASTWTHLAKQLAAAGDHTGADELVEIARTLAPD